MEKRGQSSIEFLYTYGWMLLILAAALAVLAELGIFNLGNYSGNECAISGDFRCITYSLSHTGTLTLNLEQNSQFPINVTQAGCNANETTNSIATYTPPVYIPIGSNATLTISCYGGSAVDTGLIGGRFFGYVVINYTDVYTNLPTIVYGKLDAHFS